MNWEVRGGQKNKVIGFSWAHLNLNSRFTSRFWDTRRNTSHIGCQYSRSIYTTRLIVWQPRRAADKSTNWRQSFFSVAAPRAWNRLPTELKLLRSTDYRFVAIWTHFCLRFCSRAPGYGLTLMRPRSSSRERNRSASITVYSYSFHLHRPKDLTEQDDYRRSSLDLLSHAVSSCVESHSDGPR